LAILDRQRQGEQARQIVVPLAAGWFDWQRDPAAYETARRRLAELILEGRTRNRCEDGAASENNSHGDNGTH